MLLAAILAAFFVVAVALPAVRARWRTGSWAIVFHRGADPCQRLVGAAFAGYLAAAAAWAALVATVGPARLGVWTVSAAWTGVGWALLALGFVLVPVAQAAMGASWRIGIDAVPTALVTTGPFRVVRNPIFTAMLAMLAGMVLVTPSAWTVMGGIGAGLLIGVQTRLEEEHLSRLHGAAYRAYASRVGRFLPGVGRLGPPPEAAEVRASRSRHRRSRAPAPP